MHHINLSVLTKSVHCSRTGTVKAELLEKGEKRRNGGGNGGIDGVGRRKEE